MTTPPRETTAPRPRRILGITLALLLPIQVLALGAGGGTPSATPAPTSTDAPAGTDTVSDLAAGRPTTTPPSTSASPAVGGAGVIAAPVAGLTTEPDVFPVSAAAPIRTSAAAPGYSAHPAIDAGWPAQAQAWQNPADPATTRWALLIGINDHMGRVADNYGSRQDAEDLRAHLLAQGWRDDHILLITDRNATRANIVDGIRWLAAKTNHQSLGIFHYSGHSKKWYGQDHDGDGEVTDEGIWPTDDRFIVDSEFVRLMDAVNPFALWVNFSTCNSAGFADPGLAKPGRILTFSSGEPQKSYENPAWDNSVWMYWLVDEGMRQGRADANVDGRITVEEAFWWARVPAQQTTKLQSRGQQDAVIVDLVDGDFDFVIPKPPPPPTTTTTTTAPPASSNPSGNGCFLGLCRPNR